MIRLIKHTRMLTITTVFAVFFAMVCEGSSLAGSSGSILIIRPAGHAFVQAVHGLKSELEDEFLINEMVISGESTPAQIKKQMDTVIPKAVVLMDNKAISLYKIYQKGLTGDDRIVPCISIMGVFMDLAIHGMKNTTGIYYEVPVVTSVVNLRAIMDTPFNKVGVVHRKLIDPFVEQNKQYCRKEGVELVSYGVPEKGNVKSVINKGLRHLVKKKKVNAIWVPNDSVLVNYSLLKHVWIPFARNHKIPIIVGVEILVNPRLNFGTFAVIPDHLELGVQASEIVFDAMENNWRLDNRKVEPPRSVKKIINLKQAKKRFKINEENLKYIDKIAGRSE